MRVKGRRGNHEANHVDVRRYLKQLPLTITPGDGLPISSYVPLFGVLFRQMGQIYERVGRTAIRINTATTQTKLSNDASAVSCTQDHELRTRTTKADAHS